MRWGLLALAVLLVASMFVVGREANEGVGPGDGRPASDPAGQAELVLRGRSAQGAARQELDASRPALQRHLPAPWHLRASVTVEKTLPPTPIAGAEVVVYLRLGQGLERLAAGTTGEDGAVDLDLTGLEQRSRVQVGAGALVVFAFAPGHYLRRGRPGALSELIDARLRPSPWALDLQLAPARVAHGRVAWAGGDPVEHACVGFEPGSAAVPPHPGVFTAPDGRYALPLPAVGAGLLRATHPLASGPCVEPWVVVDGPELQAPDLRLVPGAVKEGRVAFSDGTPVADLLLGIDHHAFQSSTLLWRPRWGPLRTRTDSQGRFSLALPREDDPAFAPTEYRLVLPGLTRSEQVLDVRPPRLAITLPPHRLRVRLRDVEGRPIVGMEASLRPVHRTEPVSGQSDERGEISFLAGCGSECRLMVARPGNAPHVVPVTLPTAGNESIVHVTVPEPSESSRVRFQFHAPSGWTLHPLRVRVSNLDGDTILSAHLAATADTIDLPPGRYRVRFQRTQLVPWAMDPLAFGAILEPEHPIDVQEGDLTVVALPWTKTAGIALRLGGDASVEALPPGSTIRLSTADGSVVPLALNTDTGHRSDPPAVGRWLHAYGLFPPGPYRLTVQASGYRTLEREVQLHDAQLTRVDLSLERDR